MKNLSFFTFLFLFFISQYGYTNPIIRAYQFEPGYYYMLDYPVHIRLQPNLQGEAIGMLGINSRIRIISAADQDSVQTIDGVRSLWYRIEYENITGYIWGGNIAVKTLIFDIDNNGIDDYFHYRISRIDGPYFYHVNSWNDVFIYINNIRIPTTNIFVRNSIRNSRGDISNVWGGVLFEPSDNKTVLIKMIFGDHSYFVMDTFEIDEKGKIELIEQFLEEYE